MVLDLSIRQSKSGKRVVDLAKKDLIRFIQTFDVEDTFYLYHPHVIDILTHRGDQISTIGNYDTDGYRLEDMSFALKQTYYILAAQDNETERVFCYVTDRFEKKDQVHLKKLFNLPRTLGAWESSFKFLVVSVGHDHDYDSLQECCQGKAECVLVEDASQICDALTHYFDVLSIVEEVV